MHIKTEISTPETVYTAEWICEPKHFNVFLSGIFTLPYPHPPNEIFHTRISWPQSTKFTVVEILPLGMTTYNLKVALAFQLMMFVKLIAY